MKTINTLLKNVGSRLSIVVNKSLNDAFFVTGLESNNSFYAVEGMSGKKYRYFINNLVKSLGDTSYLEVGSWAGSTMSAAIHGNKVRAVAIDNWSTLGGPKDAFFENVRSFMTPEASVLVIEGDFRAVNYEDIGTFDIYLFDGPHEEKDQYDGLRLALSALGDEFVFIVDDWNWENVRNGTLKAIKECNLEVIFSAEIRTSLDNIQPSLAFKESDWHNGYFISVLSKTKLMPESP